MSNKTTEVRIADALKNDTTAAAIAALLVEVEHALAEAEQNAAATRKAAMDVITTPDPNRARASMELAALVVGRLQTALAQLQSRCQEAEASEFLTSWQADRDRVEKLRDQAAKKFERVRGLITEMAAIFAEVEDVDKEASRVNGSSPPGQRTLKGCELIARNLAQFSQSDKSIVASTTLFGFDGKTAWPVRQPSIGVIMAQAMATPADQRYGADWGIARSAEVQKQSREQQRIAAWHQEEERLQTRTPPVRRSPEQAPPSA